MFITEITALTDDPFGPLLAESWSPQERQKCRLEGGMMWFAFISWRTFVLSHHSRNRHFCAHKWFLQEGHTRVMQQYSIQSNFIPIQEWLYQNPTVFILLLFAVLLIMRLFLQTDSLIHKYISVTCGLLHECIEVLYSSLFYGSWGFSEYLNTHEMCY